MPPLSKHLHQATTRPSWYPGKRTYRVVEPILPVRHANIVDPATRENRGHRVDASRTAITIFQWSHFHCSNAARIKAAGGAHKRRLAAWNTTGLHIHWSELATCSRHIFPTLRADCSRKIDHPSCCNHVVAAIVRWIHSLTLQFQHWNNCFNSLQYVLQMRFLLKIFSSTQFLH